MRRHHLRRQHFAMPGTMTVPGGGLPGGGLPPGGGDAVGGFRP